MMLTFRGYSFAPRWMKYRNYIATPEKFQAVQTATLDNEEYTEVAQYPEIKDLSYTARKKRRILSQQEKVLKTPTVEEKLIKINMRKYYGYSVMVLNDKRLPYNCFPAIQQYTRTIYEDMPSKLNDDQGRLSAQVDAVKGDVQDALELAHDYFSQKYPNASEIEPEERERILTQVIVEQINRALLNAFSAEYQHLQEVDVDFNPRHEAFWAVGGISPPTNVVKSKEGRAWQKHLANEPVDRFMQYKSVPMLTLRHHLQLPTFKDESEYIDFGKVEKLPFFKYDPRTLGFIKGYQHGTNIPGYWPSKLPSFGVLSYQSRAGIHIRPQGFAAEDHTEALHAHAIQSSFAWLLAQANYNGFNTYSELTYPMNTQTILTDGKNWSFYEYQLNTLLMNCSHIDKNARVNYCRGTQEIRLYQEIDDKGKVVGFNDEVLKFLLNFYTNTPNVQRSPEELQPYLSTSCKRIADYDNDEQREFLEKTFKHLMANRPRHLSLPEIYLWEKIYKIDNKTRQMEPRRRYFELFINPWKRTLGQHQKVYIPRQLRPEGHRSKKKWRPTYYP